MIEYFALPTLAAVLMVMAVAVVRMAGKLLPAWQRERATKELVSQLLLEGRVGQVMYRDADGAEWTVTIQPAERTRIPAFPARENT